MTTADDELTRAFEEALKAPPAQGNGKGQPDGMEAALRRAVAAGAIDPDAALPDAAENLREWARFVCLLEPVERELRVSDKLAVMSALHENAREIVDAALAVADLERKAAGDGGEKARPRFITAPEFAELAPERIDYLIWGYVARGMITQLAAGIKIGKTVFIMDAIRAMLTGDEFIGHMTQRCPVLYMTEEGRTSFRRNLEKAHLLDHADLHLLLRSEVHGMKWPDIGELVGAYIVEHGIGLVAVDTLSDWIDLSGDGEKDESSARRAVSIMRQWCNVTGCGVVALQHERKAGGGIGESARGSSAFGGAMDILATLQELPKPGDRAMNPTHRILAGRGRCDVPEPVVVDFDKRAHHYTMVGGVRQAAARSADEQIVAELPSCMCEYASRQYLANATGMTDTTLRRHLERLEQDRRISSSRVARKDGKGDFAVYWFPGGKK